MTPQYRLDWLVSIPYICTEGPEWIQNSQTRIELTRKRLKTSNRMEGRYSIDSTRTVIHAIEVHTHQLLNHSDTGQVFMLISRFTTTWYRSRGRYRFYWRCEYAVRSTHSKHRFFFWINRLLKHELTATRFENFQPQGGDDEGYLFFDFAVQCGVLGVLVLVLLSSVLVACCLRRMADGV